MDAVVFYRVAGPVKIDAHLKDVIDAPTEEPWGILVERVELKDISPGAHPSRVTAIGVPGASWQRRNARDGSVS